MRWLRNLVFRLVPAPHVLRVDWRADAHDTANALLSTAFAALRHYVEVEKALVYATVHRESKGGPKWWNALWWSNPALGVARLKEEEGFLIKDKPGLTSTTATEILALYDWWMRRRKTVSDLRREFARTDTTTAEALIAAEDNLAREDDEMFRRLAVVRKHLVS